MNNNLDKQYLELVERVKTEGIEKEDRTGTGTVSVFGGTIRHKMSEGFPALTSKKMSIKSISAELVWFLSGSTDIRDLWRLGCSIWDGDFHKRYHNDYCDNNPPFSGPYSHCLTKEELIQKVKSGDKQYEKYADLGPIYGAQWRNFDGIDQIKQLIINIRKDPDSRRLMVSAWNPTQLVTMILPPCHYGFQCYTRKLSLEERVAIYNKQNGPCPIEETMDQLDLTEIPERELSLSWNQRSVDLMLG